LAFAQRQIRIKYAQNSKNQQRSKSLSASIQTIGDWIQVKRMEKNLTHGHLAAKMGIATALIRSWENGTSQPDSQQLKVLAKYLDATPHWLLPTDNRRRRRGLPLVAVTEFGVTV
jgi:ribosome-binding protein aMBF1 (putative translation factor)